MNTRARRRMKGAAGILVATAALVVLAASASAGSAGRWTQITRAHNGAASNLGLARGKDGVLHVFWAGPARPPFTTITDTQISAAGAVRRKSAVVSGWNSVHVPAAVTDANGSIHVLISGQKVLANTDPFAGLNEAVGPGSWKLGARAFGTYQITVPSSADVGAGMLKSGELVSVWRSATTLLFQAGVEPTTQPQNITPPGLAESPVIAVDQASGEAIVGYRHVSSGADFFRRILPSLGPPQPMPQAKVLAPSIAARVGGGVFSAYPPDVSKVWLLRFGGRRNAVPVPKGARALTAGVAAGPDGRLWVFYGNEQQTFVTRTNKAVTSFEPVQMLKSPPGTVQYFRLEGEGSAGPLDLFADVTVDGKTKDGSYHTHVFPLAFAVRRQEGAEQPGLTDSGTRDRARHRRRRCRRRRPRHRPTRRPETTDARGSVVVTVSSRPEKQLRADGHEGRLPSAPKEKRRPDTERRSDRLSRQRDHRRQWA